MRSTFEVEIDGRARHVTIESTGASDPRGGRFRVTVDNEIFELTAVTTNLGVSLVYAGEGRTVDAAVTAGSNGEWLVQLPHVTLTALLDGRRYQRGGAEEVSRAGAQRVTAPMPGRVVRVLVQPGDDVVARQGLVVVEAMKMENELGSPKAGRVTEVAVAEGTPVETGQLLAIVE